MGGKSKSTSKQDNSIDRWSQQQYEQGRSQVQGILDSNPFQSYGGQRTAGISGAEQAAMDNYGAQAGTAGGILQNAASGAQQAYQGGPQSIEARSYADFDQSAYSNPYDSMVMDRTMADLDRARQITMNGTEAGQHRSAFGGARHGVSDSLTNERFIDQVGNASASLNQQGYDRALGLYGQDMDRAQGVDQFNVGQQNQYDQGILARSGMMGQLGSAYAQNAANEASMMSALGSNARGIEQGELDRQYQEFLRSQEDPYRRAGVQMGILGSTPIITDSEGTQTQSQGPNWGEIAGQGAQAAAMIWSDMALKQDVKPLGKRGNHNWYSYRYNWDDEGTHREGVMAQEVLQTQPEAVQRHDNGFLMVNYEVLN